MIPSKVIALIKKSEVSNRNIILKTTPIYLDAIKNSTSLFVKIVTSPSIQPMERK